MRERIARLESNLRGEWVIVLIAAFIVRLAHWLAVRAHDPLYALTLPETDMHTYWMWAKSIVEGDWLSRSQGAFYYGPLYPYWLAIWFVIFGPNFESIHVVQMCLGVLPPLLVWSMGRMLGGPFVGLVAGLFIAFAAPAIFYEQLLLMEGLLMTLHAGFLWCGVRAFMQGGRRSAWYAAGAGLLGGLAALGRGNFLLVAAAFLPGWYFASRWSTAGGARSDAPSLGPPPVTTSFLAASPSRLALRNTLAYALALGLILGGSFLRNGIIGDKWVVATSNGPILLYIGNAADSLGIFHYPDSFAALERQYGGREAVPWSKEVLRSIMREPAAWLVNVARKGAMFISGYEIADNANAYLFSRWSPLVRFLLPWYWSVVVAMGLVGAWLARRRWRDFFPLYLYAVSFAVSIIAVFVVGRYRLEFLLPMAVFAGEFVRAVALSAQGGRQQRLAAVGAALALSVALMPRWSPAVRYNSPGGLPGVRYIRPNDYGLLARAYLNLGRKQDVLATLAEGFAQHPWDVSLASNYATMLEEDGQVERAIETLNRYLLCMPGDSDMAVELARLLARSRRFSESEQILRRVIAIVPDHAKARDLLAAVRASSQNQ